MAPDTTEETITLDEALTALTELGPQARPYACRIESACNSETLDVINTWAVEAHRGSRSDAIRDLIGIAAAALAAGRA